LAARRASDGDDSGNELWISPRRCRRGVLPPEAGKKSGVSERKACGRAAEDDGAPRTVRGDELGKCSGEDEPGTGGVLEEGQ
jgi:hypothetical protein